MISDRPVPLGLALHPTLHGSEPSLLTALLGCTDYAVLVTSLTTRQDVLCNARFGEIFGIDPSETVHWSPTLVQERVLPRISDPQSFLDDLEAVYNDARLVRVDELELRDPDQTLRRHTCPLQSSSGETLWRVWTFLDITALKRLQREVERHAQDMESLVAARSQELRMAQQQLVRSEKLAAVGLVASTVAHEIRNIITPLQLDVSAMEIADPDVSCAVKCQLERLGTLTHRLLALRQPQQLSLRRLDLRTIWGNVERIVRAQAEAEGCGIEARLPDDPLMVTADADALDQLFINLAFNAFASMPDQGKLILSFSTEESRAVVRFTDTGPGIREEVLVRLFEPFVTARANGTGLGLFISRRIARDHYGDLTVERTGPDGTTFVLSIPKLDRECRRTIGGTHERQDPDPG